MFTVGARRAVHKPHRNKFVRLCSGHLSKLLVAWNPWSSKRGMFLLRLLLKRESANKTRTPDLSSKISESSLPQPRAKVPPKWCNDFAIVQGKFHSNQEELTKVQSPIRVRSPLVRQLCACQVRPRSQPPTPTRKVTADFARRSWALCYKSCPSCKLQAFCLRQPQEAPAETRSWEIWAVDTCRSQRNGSARLHACCDSTYPRSLLRVRLCVERKFLRWGKFVGKWTVVCLLCAAHTHSKLCNLPSSKLSKTPDQTRSSFWGFCWCLKTASEGLFCSLLCCPENLMVSKWQRLRVGKIQFQSGHWSTCLCVANLSMNFVVLISCHMHWSQSFPDHGACLQLSTRCVCLESQSESPVVAHVALFRLSGRTWPQSTHICCTVRKMRRKKWQKSSQSHRKCQEISQTVWSKQRSLVENGILEQQNPANTCQFECQLVSPMQLLSSNHWSRVSDEILHIWTGLTTSFRELKTIVPTSHDNVAKGPRTWQLLLSEKNCFLKNGWGLILSSFQRFHFQCEMTTFWAKHFSLQSWKHSDFQEEYICVCERSAKHMLSPPPRGQTEIPHDSKQHLPRDILGGKDNTTEETWFVLHSHFWILFWHRNQTKWLTSNELLSRFKTHLWWFMVNSLCSGSCWFMQILQTCMPCCSFSALDKLKFCFFGGKENPTSWFVCSSRHWWRRDTNICVRGGVFFCSSAARASARASGMVCLINLMERPVAVWFLQRCFVWCSLWDCS